MPVETKKIRGRVLEGGLASGGKEASIIAGRVDPVVRISIDPDRPGRLKRLWQFEPAAVASPGLSAHEAVDWDRLDEEIQATLTKIWEAIETRFPKARSRWGRTRSERFPLFSYRRFCRADLQEEDPVIAGVEIKSQGVDYRISAEIGREESGLVMLSESVEISGSHRLLEQAVRTLLDRLVASRGLIEEALLGSA